MKPRTDFFWVKVGDVEINEKRFWSKVDANGNWIAYTKRGYGWFGVWVAGKQKSMYAHVLAWMMKNGPIPKGMQVLHKNDIPGCVFTSQLFIGTQRDNMEDCKRKGRTSHVGNRGNCKGEDHATSKLTNKKVKRARVLATKGWSLNDIAKSLGVSKGNIWLVVTRRTWKHV